MGSLSAVSRESQATGKLVSRSHALIKEVLPEPAGGATSISLRSRPSFNRSNKCGRIIIKAWLMKLRSIAISGLTHCLRNRGKIKRALLCGVRRVINCREPRARPSSACRKASVRQTTSLRPDAYPTHHHALGLSIPCIVSQLTKAVNQPVLVVSLGYMPKP